jgi:hypothetical protein
MSKSYSKHEREQECKQGLDGKARIKVGGQYYNES